MSLDVSRPAEVPGPPAAPARVLVILPGHYESPAALAAFERALASVAAQPGEPADVVAVLPPGTVALRGLAARWRARVVDDPGAGPAAAVNAGVGTAAPHHRYVSWLTVHDELLPGALPVAAARLDARPDAVAAYGDCRLVVGGAGRDPDGDEEYLCTTHAASPSSWRLLAGTADLARPAVLVRLSAWRAAGDLDVTLRYAMDLDLLLRLRSHGPFVSTGRTLAVSHRPSRRPPAAEVAAATAEVASVRRRHLPPPLRRVAGVLDVPQRVLLRRSAAVVQRAATSCAVDAGR